jgi:hypothetical protein
MSFSVDIANFVNKTKANANTAVKKVVMDISKAVVMRTPVGDAKYWKNPAPAGYTGGHARANWSHSEGSLVKREFEGTDKSGATSQDRIAASIGDKPAGGVHFISNSVPYIQALEDGHSHQAPNGMVGLTAREFRQFVDNATKGLK